MLTEGPSDLIYLSEFNFADYLLLWSRRWKIDCYPQTKTSIRDRLIPEEVEMIVGDIDVTCVHKFFRRP